MPPSAIDNGSNDNCAIDSSWLSKYSFTCADTGANVVLLSIRDVNGNLASKSATVSVRDTLAPTALTQNITIYLDNSGMASITTDIIDNGSSDKCAMDSSWLSKYSFTCADTGANVVTLTVGDVNENFASKTSIVTVIDSFRTMEELVISGPNIICPGVRNNWSVPMFQLATSYEWFYNNKSISSGVSRNDFNFAPSASDTLKVKVRFPCETLTAYLVITLSESRICDLEDCGEESIHIDDEFGLLPSDIHAISHISSNGRITEGNRYSFSAGDSIILLPGFQVDLGGIFEVYIEPCNAQTNATSNPGKSENTGDESNASENGINALSKNEKIAVSNNRKN